MKTNDTVEDRKRKAIDRLTSRFSQDEIPMDEYERLVADIERAVDERELAVIEDIVSGRDGLPLPSAGPDIPGFIPMDQVQSCVALLAERRHSGPWLRKSVVAAVSCLGSQIFDFRGVDLPAGRTTLEVLALFGSIEIIVPRTLAVRMEAVAFAGDASVGPGVETAEKPDSALLVVSGNAVFGSVGVKIA